MGRVVFTRNATGRSVDWSEVELRLREISAPLSAHASAEPASLHSGFLAISSDLPLTASLPLANDPAQPCEMATDFVPAGAAAGNGAARSERDPLEMLVLATAGASARS